MVLAKRRSYLQPFCPQEFADAFVGVRPQWTHHKGSANDRMITQIEGTEGAQAGALVGVWPRAYCMRCLAHWQKGRHDPWLDPRRDRLFLLLMAALSRFLFLPWPRAATCGHFCRRMGIHHCLQLLHGLGLTKGLYTVVYPVVAGDGGLCSRSLVPILIIRRELLPAYSGSRRGWRRSVAGSHFTRESTRFKTTLMIRGPNAIR